MEIILRIQSVSGPVKGFYHVCLQSGEQADGRVTGTATVFIPEDIGKNYPIGQKFSLTAC